MFGAESPRGRYGRSRWGGPSSGGAGLRIRSGEAETFLTRLAALELSPSMTTTLAPLRREIEVLNDELARADEQFENDGGCRSNGQAADDRTRHRADYGQCLCRRAGRSRSI